ncbi:hypothetical protein DUK53_16865 [Listeria sp. SHR_NRA_18]|uniref:hypothetical protein n=1 Tax=Listeria sp. SHR_NRA_18 TaxID=2269046 RepID=UPI000F5E050D|nr:hypothetical protein [Listeria sp. SHR_NRA_18]RQW65341.1 hypothetical protein DUK53_16865 [Listeria sp. SHR_NRA_18]
MADTFGNWLERTEYFDGELAIDNCYMEPSFVWNSEYTKIKDEGKRLFQALIDAEYEFINNNTINLKLDGAKYFELGELFGLALAGYIADSMYNRLFDTGEYLEEDVCF